MRGFGLAYDRLGSDSVISALRLQCPACPKADTAERFMSTRPGTSLRNPAVLRRKLRAYKVTGASCSSVAPSSHAALAWVGDKSGGDTMRSQFLTAVLIGAAMLVGSEAP